MEAVVIRWNIVVGRILSRSLERGNEAEWTIESTLPSFLINSDAEFPEYTVTQVVLFLGV